MFAPGAARLLRLLLILATLVYAFRENPSFAQPSERSSHPDSGSGTNTYEPPPPGSEPDIKALEGDGVNPGPFPVQKPAPGGRLIKDVGSSTWRFERNLAPGEMEEEARRRSEEKLRKYGNLPVDLMVALRDSIHVDLLDSLGVEIGVAPPCTVQVRVLYRQVAALDSARIVHWKPGEPPPGTRRDSRKDLLRPPKGSESPGAVPYGPPAQGSPAQEPMPSGGGGGGSRASAAPTSVLIFSEGFETNPVPGSVWSATDYNSTSGYDYWGDLSTSCALAHSGSWSADAAGNGDTPCRSYDNDQSANMQNITAFNCSAYQSIAVSFWVNYSTETNFDYFRWYAGGIGDLSIPQSSRTGSSGGWIQLGFTFINTSHNYDNFYLRFQLESDNTVTAYGGIYVDDIQIQGTPFPQPNLTSYTPSGWSGPIVPSSVTGTTTTGALTAGQPTYIDWAIRNVGDGGTSSTFYVDYYLDNSWIGYGAISGLGAFTTNARLDWSYTVATAGSHTLKMVIDPTGAVAESNEGDNVYQATFSWAAPPQPDLVVQAVTVSVVGGAAPPAAAPAAGEAITVTAVMGQTLDYAVTVKNLGPGSVPSFFDTGLFLNLPGQPSVGLTPDQALVVLPLAPGASQVLHFFVTHTRPETWTSYLLADVYGTVSEVLEANNPFGPISVTWVPDSLSVTGSFAYDDSLEGPNRAFRCARVVLFDRDGSGVDDTLAVGYMSEFQVGGSFILGPVSNEDVGVGDDHSFLDPYVRVYYETRAPCINAILPDSGVVTVADSSGVTWSFDSPVTTNAGNGTLNLGVMKPTDYGRRWAMHIYRTILNKGWGWVAANGGPPPPVQVRWEPGRLLPTRYDGISTISLSASATASQTGPDEMDDHIILHEYGHHVARTLGFDQSPGGPHSMFAACSSLPLAWSEGWAHYFAASRLGVPQHALTLYNAAGQPFSGSIDFENGTVQNPLILTPAPQPNERGPLWELAVAGTLWDFYDSQSDNPDGDNFADSLSDGALNQWAALRNTGPGRVATILDFRTVYDSLYAHPLTNWSKFRLSQYVFLEHGIDGGPNLTGVDVSGTPPRPHHSLFGNRPNPFNPITRIEFEIGGNHDIPVMLGIFDVHGRLVRNLIRGNIRPGRYVITWNGVADNGQPAASGAYFCRLAAGLESRTIKMMLLK